MNKSDSLKDSNEELKKSVRRRESSQEIEDRHQDLLGHIKAVQYTHDLQGQLLSVNQEITEFLGYDKNSLLNMNIRNLLAPEVRHEFDTYLAEMKRQGNAKGLMLVQTAIGEKRILIYNNTLQTEGVATPTVQGIAYDITKYIQTERALRQVSGQLSVVLESLPIVCYIGKAEGDYGATYITHNIKAITGFEDTNFTSKSSFWADRIHPEDAPRIFANLPQIFEKGYHEHQYRWQVADGSYKWFYDYMRVIISSNGKKCIIGMMQDITERKRAEEALLHAAQQWRTTFDGISDIVCLLDPEGKILKCNKALTHFLGKPFSEILNRPYWAIIYGAAAPIKESPILRMLETRCRETAILPITDRWFNIAVDPLFDKAGSFIGGVYIMSDITEHKRAVENLRVSEEQFRSLFNGVPVGLYRVTPMGQILDVNKALVRILGYPDRESLVAVRVDDTYVNPKDRMEFKTLIETQGVVRHLERQLRRCDGTIVWVEENAHAVLNSQGQIIYYEGSLSDITYRKRAEEMSKRLAKENAIVAEIGRIISSTLNINEVYEQFGEEVRKVIPFDRMAINLIYPERDAYVAAYIEGKDVAGYRPEDVDPLAGSLTGEIVGTRSSMLIQEEDREEVTSRFPALLPFFHAGFRSFISVPLISKDQVIAVLHIFSIKSKAYTEADKNLAESIGAQIAGAIANANLFTELKRSEEAIKQERETFFTMLDKAPYGAALIDTDERYLYLNPEFTAITGYTLEDIPTRKEWLQKAYPDPAYRQKAIKTWRKKFDYREVERIFSVVCKSSEVRVIEFRPNLLKDGQILVMLSDITELKRSEEALRKSEEITRALFSISNAVNTTRDLDELYRSIHQSLGRIIDVTNFFIALYDKETDSLHIPYFVDAVDDLVTDYFNISSPNSNSHTAIVIKTGKPVLHTKEDFLKYLSERNLKPGMTLSKIWLGVPLKIKNEVIGAIVVHSHTNPNLYDEKDVDILLSVSNQVALVIDRKRAEEALRRSEEEAKRLAQENAIVAEIGRIISSSLNIDEVYERFSEEVHKLIPFDRIAILIIYHERGMYGTTYITGKDIPGHRPGDVAPLAGSLTEEVVRKRSGMLVTTKDRDEVASRFPGLLPEFEVGLRSCMAVPLISKDQIIGVMHVQSAKPNTYTERDLRLAERVGHQIAGAISNAQLFIERKRAEEALQKSEEEAKRLAQENAIMAEIGRIITSTLNIEEVYERFAEEVRKLIPFDRIVINIINPEDNTTTIAYISGVYVEGRQFGDILPLFGTATGECIRTRSNLLIQTDNIDEVIRRFPALLPSFQARLRSMIFIPLVSKDQVIGVLSLRATKPNAYTERDLGLAERVSSQISGAIANAQLFNERLCAEEKMKALEDQLRQSQKMEAVGRLAGGVAHDFNNLLTVVKGYSQISLVMLKEGDPLKENIEEIQKAANRAANLTKQLLVFSRRQILELKVFHLNTILQDLDKMLHRIIGEDIELVYSLSNDLGQVKSDPTQMEQVILNLAINAKDAMPSGGKLTIETSNATLDESYTDSHIGVTPGNYVMLSVSDTGVGMTPEIKERIFEPFFTTKEKGKGTGLGLSIVYGIVQQSGGSIWVYSELGLGTTFKVFLPRIEEDAESLRPTAVPTKSLQGSETILVVEDEEIVRKLACKVLEKNGYRVLEASNGEEALYIVQKQNGNPIHLVVTDVVMPGLSGRQLVDRLVSLWPQTKALYMSGYTNDVIVHHGVLDPGIAYIQKPFTPDDLILKVRKVLDGP